METGNARTCTYCGKDRSWIFSGKKLKDGSKIYVDEHDARWSGRRCPECERSRVYEAVRCDSFERDIIIKQLNDSGFAVSAKTLPLKATKDGRIYTVGVKRAFTQGGKIVLETPVEPNQELVALVFESVRVLTAEQLSRLGQNLAVRGTGNDVEAAADEATQGLGAACSGAVKGREPPNV